MDVSTRTRPARRRAFALAAVVIAVFAVIGAAAANAATYTLLGDSSRSGSLRVSKRRPATTTKTCSVLA